MSANAACFLTSALITGNHLLKYIQRLHCAFLGSIFIVSIDKFNLNNILFPLDNKPCWIRLARSLVGSKINNQAHILAVDSGRMWDRYDHSELDGNRKLLQMSPRGVHRLHRAGIRSRCPLRSTFWRCFLFDLRPHGSFRMHRSPVRDLHDLLLQTVRLDRFHYGRNYVRKWECKLERTFTLQYPLDRKKRFWLRSVIHLLLWSRFQHAAADHAPRWPWFHTCIPRICTYHCLCGIRCNHRLYREAYWQVLEEGSPCHWTCDLKHWYQY